MTNTTADSMEMELHGEELHQQSEAVEQKKAKPGHLEILYGNEFKKNNTAHLKNGAEVNVEAVSLPSFQDGKTQLLTRAVEHEGETGDAGQDDAEDVRQKNVAEVLTEREVDKNLVETLDRIFRSFGDQVGMVKKGDSIGFDPWKEGHRFDFNKSLNFVIAESRAEEMKALIKNPPAASAGEMAPAFAVKPRFDWFAQEDGKKKLGMVFYYEAPDGKESKPVVFLFGKEKEEKDEEKSSSAEAMEDKPEINT
ncbi:MAG: hypothetical protein US42_C0004G0052 [Candidatus Magasanikbacteria bacterium GW2011_GWC2_37_14]|uniref:Uncharacterized protein n=1 Tax=Candidatus Magasanikbacteria bacterium GW2011_GWC2_37_14 TaxID=1619046 RepID=A0A0G0G9X0_9BACT|nr:MAG: hypothetical protein US42_C0004G0052 [Candidatus Magasanikbacteria bacterium GW2011_GWC2_37_14]